MNKRTLCILVILLISGLPVFAQSQKMVTVTGKLFPVELRLVCDGAYVAPQSIKNMEATYTLPAGEHVITLSAPGYASKQFTVTLAAGSRIEEKLEKFGTGLTLLSEVRVGRQPKSVEFSPDGKYMVAPLLDEFGVDVISTETLEIVARLTPPNTFLDESGKVNDKGFVESTFVPSRNELWVSQMTTAMIHVFSLETMTYIRSFSTKGSWSKVVIVDPQEKWGYISNWLSNDVSVVDVANYTVVKKIKVSDVPRGLVLSPDGKYLYVAIYGNGDVEKVDLAAGKVVKIIKTGYGAARHMIPDYVHGRFYVSDMWKGKVLAFSFETDELVASVYVGWNLNTIALTPDAKTIFVSSRGKNNEETYLVPGPDFGKVTAIDTESFTIRSWIWGRNQPTGLAVSPDGSLLAFTDFLDRNVEVYSISK